MTKIPDWFDCRNLEVRFTRKLLDHEASLVGKATGSYTSRCTKEYIRFCVTVTYSPSQNDIRIHLFNSLHTEWKEVERFTAADMVHHTLPVPDEAMREVAQNYPHAREDVVTNRARQRLLTAAIRAADTQEAMQALIDSDLEMALAYLNRLFN